MVWELTIATLVSTVFVILVVFYALSQRHRPQEALKNVQQKKPKVAGARGSRASDRRRSERTELCVPVLIYGHALGEEAFYEEATTFQVSAHGGLLALTTTVKVGQKLLLTNNLTQEEQECHVVRFERRDREKFLVAIEFTRPTPHFWRTEAQHPQAASR